MMTKTKSGWRCVTDVEISCENQSIEIMEREVLADHQIQYVQFKFTFDGNWKHYHKTVQFSQCDEVFNVVLGYDSTSCYLPAELHVGAVKMSVFGYDAESDTTVRATTVPVTLNIRESGFEGDDPPIPPTPDLYQQLLKKIDSATAGNLHMRLQWSMAMSAQRRSGWHHYTARTASRRICPSIRKLLR